MDGKAFFVEKCKRSGLDAEVLFVLGTGKTYAKAKGRYEYNVGERYKNKGTALFAVKYYSDPDLYIAWSLREPKAALKRVFSISAHSISGFSGNSVYMVPKGIEYESWDTEQVYIFGRDSIDEFLERYIRDQ